MTITKTEKKMEKYLKSAGKIRQELGCVLTAHFGTFATDGCSAVFFNNTSIIPNLEQKETDINLQQFSNKNTGWRELAGDNLLKMKNIKRYIKRIKLLDKAWGYSIPLEFDGNLFDAKKLDKLLDILKTTSNIDKLQFMIEEKHINNVLYIKSDAIMVVLLPLRAEKSQIEDYKITCDNMLEDIKKEIEVDKIIEKVGVATNG